ncbi:MAG: hypothetical protein WC278_05975 [Bacilli bacterium]|jgi:hypothetical protein|nr:hypothetical protein [Bacilli bacterium]MDD3121791.1 hypothetical protein [Bacilli bacterium]MDD4063797.1 hypothetical protein [Bacilli bacterium]MDD4482643.1 hypothetical protein [Bacilli bacterium]MDY0364022.1 hypothetical protein [Bacilli bacterium]
MLLFLIYIIAGGIISDYLARRKMKFAEMAHAIFFVVFGFFLLFIPFADIRVVAELIIGKESYDILSQVIYEPLESAWISFSILTLLTATTAAITIIAISILAVENIYMLNLPNKNIEIETEQKSYDKLSVSTYIKNRLFLINCRFRN